MIRRPGAARSGIARLLSSREVPPPTSGGLFESLSEIARRLEGLGQQIDEKTAREGNIVFGYSIRTGLDGARAEAFGHVPQKGREQEPPPRQPIVEIFEEGPTIVIVAEMPGVPAARITTRVESDALVIETSGTPRWHKRVVLPGPVDPASLVTACRNGILELRLARAA